MTSFKLIGAALVLSAIAAAPASAWEAIQEPGAYAFYHPNSDVLNGGSSRSADALASATTRSDVQLSVRSRHVNRAPVIKRY
jgi:hypothetical protein